MVNNSIHRNSFNERKRLEIKRINTLTFTTTKSPPNIYLKHLISHDMFPLDDHINKRQQNQYTMNFSVVSDGLIISVRNNRHRGLDLVSLSRSIVVKETKNDISGNFQFIYTPIKLIYHFPIKLKYYLTGPSGTQVTKGIEPILEFYRL